MKIRFGIRKDIDIVAPLMVEMWMAHVDEEPDYISKDVIEESDGKKHLEGCFDETKDSWLLVAEDEGEMVGFCKVDIQMIQEFFNERKVMYLDDMYVMPNLEEWEWRNFSSLVQKVWQRKKI